MLDDNDARRVDDALSYPFITQEVDSSRRAGATGTTGSSQYAQMVQGALRDILGWRTRDNDPKGFTAALTQSFKPTEINGMTKWNWTPHTYAIQADLGAITGAQAAIYSRAKVALDQSLPLLEGLKPLRADVDIEDAEAVRAIVRSSLLELVQQLGEEGGPLNTRVDGYFTMLLGDDEDEVPTASSQLGHLRQTFGLERARVNTIAEEQNLTNFLILVDYVNSLHLTWDSQRDAFDRTGSDAFLGTQSVLLGRALAVVAEGVQETYFVMDTVFLGQAEREITELELDIDGTETRVFIGELLNWVENFALEEGPRLIQEGGKDGIIHSFQPTIRKLTQLVKAAADASHNGSTTDDEPVLLTAAGTGNGSGTNPTAGFHAVRVGRALDDLSHHLEKTAERADQIKRDLAPSIAAVFPTPSSTGNGSILLLILGENFKPDATLHLEEDTEGPGRPDIPLEIILSRESQLMATVDPEVVTGRWSAVVTNPDGQFDESDSFTIGEDESGDEGEKSTPVVVAPNSPAGSPTDPKSNPAK